MVKFILLGHARSGSNLLTCGLFKHPHVHMFGELFNELEEERRRAFAASFKDCAAASAPHPGVSLDENEVYRDEEDASAFLGRAVFYKHAREPVAVGFKMFAHQARTSDNARKAWDYLGADKEVRVIHLTRRNVLDSMVSLYVAFQTDAWVAPRNVPAPEPPPPLNIPPEECEAYFRKVMAGRRWARARFRHHPMLEIEYEADLCDRFQATMYRVQDFLGVPRRRARKMLEKQARRGPAQQVSNYGELKAHFARTPYAVWFGGGSGRARARGRVAAWQDAGAV
jgi:LPS sulfotransferase NodH